MNKEGFLSTARGILECPTAPFHEDAVAAKICELLTECPHVRTRFDGFGNIVATYRRGSRKLRYAFAAHMDHPGFVGGKFLGGVPQTYLEKNSRIEDFGAFAMWDLPAFELRDDRIHSRACDDLIGCAAIVTMFQELERAATECTCIGIFTRAEEVGFVGAIELAKSGAIPKTVTIISLETSKELPPAKMGDGPIIRVGDRTSIFDSDATATLVSTSAAAEIPHQRCLMSGGTCEATAYQLYGYRCGALTVALGNYHNCGPRDRIDPEFVSADDAWNMSRLCVALARDTRPASNASRTLRQKLERNARDHTRTYQRPNR